MNILDIKTKEINQMTCLGISSLRKSSGLSLAALAEMTGVTKSYLSQIEHCKKEPSIRTIFKIATAFGVDVTYLISGGRFQPAGCRCGRTVGRSQYPEKSVEMPGY